MIHVLLTRTPLYSQYCYCFLVRLACVKRAASVDSEPGSNSRLNRLFCWPAPVCTETNRSLQFEFKLLTKFLLIHARRLRILSPSLRSGFGNATRFAFNQIVKHLRMVTRDFAKANYMPASKAVRLLFKT